jgi:hypothetical protein
MHGFKGLYKGLGLTMFGAIPFVATRMAVFDIMMSNQSYFVVMIDKGSENQTKKKGLGLFWNALSGSVAGLSAVLLLYPGDLVRRHL